MSTEQPYNRVARILEEARCQVARTVNTAMVHAYWPREAKRSPRHYHLDAILAVGFRVRTDRDTQFRKWATAHLSESLVKDFTRDRAAGPRNGLAGEALTLCADVAQSRSSPNEALEIARALGVAIDDPPPHE